nr:unnamed protein product [Callosobruchus analis]
MISIPEYISNFWFYFFEDYPDGTTASDYTLPSPPPQRPTGSKFHYNQIEGFAVLCKIGTTNKLIVGGILTMVMSCNLGTTLLERLSFVALAVFSSVAAYGMFIDAKREKAGETGRHNCYEAGALAITFSTRQDHMKESGVVTPTRSQRHGGKECLPEIFIKRPLALAHERPRMAGIWDYCCVSCAVCLHTKRAIDIYAQDVLSASLGRILKHVRKVVYKIHLAYQLPPLQ